MDAKNTEKSAPPRRSNVCGGIHLTRAGLEWVAETVLTAIEARR